MSSTSALSDSPSPQSAPTVGATSDSGLAEWTTRIKEMQRQVDADEEAEQRRLEEEIVRTRLARQRRLRSGQSGDFGIGMRGIDIKSPTAAVRSVESDESNSCTREKLTPPITFSKPITKAATASGVKRAPISLAEFMGGSASGPRLKRHEPQIDPSRAYDGRMEHGSVHPIFGRGGVAMPGMVGQGGEGAPARSAATVVAAALSTNSPVSSNGPLATDQPRRRTTSTLSAALRYAEKLNEQAPPRAQTPRLSGLGIRERRTSTPGGSSSSENKVNASPTAFSPRSENFTGNTVKSDISANPPAIHSATGPLPKVLVSHTIEPRSDVFVSDVRNRDPISEARLKTLPDNAQVGTLTQIVSSPYMNSPSTAPTSPSVPPKSSFSSSGRMTPDSQPERGNAPAFLRPRTSSIKDPTPSISRLQGRGFVQSIVRASEAGSQARSVGVKNALSSSPAQTSPEGEVRDKITRGTSVLDRWQPGMNNAPPSPLHRTSSPTHSLLGDPKQSQDISNLPKHGTSRSVRSAVSMSAIPKMGVNKSDSASEQSVDKKLGSANTKITVIKPGCTDDSPPIPVVDELGIKKEGLAVSEVVTKDLGERGATIPTTPKSPSSSGKPLSHPTKNRAKKPRKVARFEEAKESGSGMCEIPPSASFTLGAQSTESSSSSAAGALFPDTRHTDPAGPPVVLHPEFTPQAKVSPPHSGCIISDWEEGKFISTKTLLVPAPGPPPSSDAHGTAGMTERRALLCPAEPLPTMPLQGVQDDSAGVTTRDAKEYIVCASHVRNARIPSTGNRSRVMDVAQAMNDTCQSLLSTSPSQEPSTSLCSSLESNSVLAPSVKKRKSNYGLSPELAAPAARDKTVLLSTPIDALSRAVKANDVSKSNMTCGLGPGGEDEDIKEGHANIESGVVRIDFMDQLLPEIDVQALLEANSPLPFVPSPDLTTVSIEVMSILHEKVTLIPCDTSILYDTELLVIVHRVRTHKSGLVTTKSRCGEREEGKVGKLAARYGTSPEYVRQQRKLAIRQGSRAHWSSENTTMHAIRSNNKQILIDELDLRIRNLCSGYSYCVTIMNNVYVWYGTGSRHWSTQDPLATGATTVVELTEGENDRNDDLFWMIMGDFESYAKGRLLEVEAGSGNAGAPVRPVPVLSAETISQESTYVIDCCWEFFVVVGKRARGKRADITLAVDTAMLVAESRPLLPTVHVLILPTQLPLDMRLAFRNLDELALVSSLFDYMNILSVKEAVEHLQKLEWGKSALSDQTMLPLGLDTSHVPLL
ncbi:hypothetical protein EDD16DRAFT_1610736 [Pisolithus croceorrhizus]|nr:hypothetical protein EDD16DRAFT_1610736 [Pisolithus croceorrhizus]